MDRGKLFFIGTLWGLFIMILIFFCFIVPEQQARIANRQAILEEHQTHRSELKKFMELHSDLKEYESGLTRQLQQIRRLMPGEMDTADFIHYTERTAEKTQVTIRGMQPLPPVGSDGYFMQQLRIDLNGNYFQLMDFLSALEQGPRFVRFISISIQSKEQEYLEGSLELLIYALSA